MHTLALAPHHLAQKTQRQKR